MRELLLIRLAELRAMPDGNLSKGTMRWKNVTMFEKHISELVPAELDDEALLLYYERIVRQMQKCY